MAADLHTIVRSQQMSKMTDHVLKLMRQIFEGMKFMHESNVLHRDIKPGNILVNYDCGVKIADYGLGKLINAKVNNDGDLTDEV
jgi:serine/threonine protein kinase